MTEQSTEELPKYTEKEVNDDIEILTETVGQLTLAIQTQNDVLLNILHQLDLKDPGWETREDIEKDVGPKIKACIEAVRKTYGPSEADKS